MKRPPMKKEKTDSSEFLQNLSDSDKEKLKEIILETICEMLEGEDERS